MSDLPRSEPSIEELILSAAHHVRPSRDLRPSTIEAARKHCQVRRSERKLGGLTLAIILLLLISSPMARYGEQLRARYKKPNAVEIERLALEYSHDRQVGAHFGLSEAFNRLRQSQAVSFGQLMQELH
ncbi:MAG: hypothetical protein P8L85_01525 [Rubripirellula sp.]|nr:hypothetical protein [Rubripirellula sp.]